MGLRRDVYDSPTTWIQPHYPSFDGLRALAMLAVFAMHYGDLILPWKVNYPPLWAGVDLFFVLSGFLITGILVDSVQDRYFFRNFYGRRALRVFPLFYGFFLVLMLAEPIFHLRADRYAIATLLYFGNLCVKGYILGHHGNPTLVWIPAWHLPLAFGNLWSLCVEEQYYLAWPFVILIIRKQRTLLRLCGWGVLATLMLRVFLYVHSSPAELATRFLYYTTWTRCDALLIGSGLALWLRAHTLSRRSLHRIGHLLVLTGVAALALGFALFGRRWHCTEVNPVFETYGYTALALCGAGLLMLALDTSSLLAKLLCLRPLSSLGRISYGMYFFHGVPIFLVRHLTDRFLLPRHLSAVAVVLTFGWTWAVAWLSYRYFESPLLRWKRYFQPQFDTPPDEAAGTSGTPALTTQPATWSIKAVAS